MPTAILASLVDVVQMAKHSITLDRKLRESNRELEKAQRVLQVTSSAFLEAQHLAFSKSGKAGSCCDQLKGVKEQLDLVHYKAISLEAASADAAVGSNGELARS